MSVALVPHRDLVSLAATANQHHASAVGSASTTLAHAIEAGRALLAARDLLRRGEWRQWIDDNCDFSTWTANAYIRLAAFSSEIPADALSQAAALSAIADRALPRHGEDGQHPLRDEIRALARAGMSRRNIAAELGLSESVVTRVVDPSGYRRRATARRRLRRAERKALERQRRDALARQSTGAVSEAYALTRRLAQVLDRALEESTPGQRNHLLSALSDTHCVEDAVVRALREAT